MINLFIEFITDLASGFVTVHDGHLTIHQYQLVVVVSDHVDRPPVVFGQVDR
jgi:hypothetical protein